MNGGRPRRRLSGQYLGWGSIYMFGKALFLAGLAASAAMAIADEADWARCAEGEDGGAWDWRPAVTKRDGFRNVITWVRETPKSPLAIFPANPGGPKYNYSLMNMHINCTATTYKIVSRHFYSKNGSILRTVQSNDDFAPAVPDSIASGVVSAVCAAME